VEFQELVNENYPFKRITGDHAVPSKYLTKN